VCSSLKYCAGLLSQEDKDKIIALAGDIHEAGSSSVSPSFAGGIELREEA
jgi:hypothetical protein